MATPAAAAAPRTPKEATWPAPESPLVVVSLEVLLAADTAVTAVKARITLENCIVNMK